MFKSKILNTLLCILSVFILSQCQNEEDHVVSVVKQGHIKGTLIGTTSETLQDFNEKFNFSLYSPYLGDHDFNYYKISNDNKIQISLRRFDTYGNYSNINFDLSSALDTVALNSKMIFNFSKEEKNHILYFRFFDGTPTFQNVKFNAESGALSGSFNLSGDQNSTDRNAVVNGEFDVILKRAIF